MTTIEWTDESSHHARSYLPQNTILGKLEEVEVYEFYDRPCLFSCKNTIGIYYLAVLVNDNADVDVWLYSPMSRDRFNQVRSGIIDMKEAFTQAQGDSVYRLTERRNSSIEVESILCVLLSDSILPKTDERIMQCRRLYNHE